MWVYWLMFLGPAWVAIAHHENSPVRVRGTLFINFGWLAALFLITLLVGYRFQVGGDWYEYFSYLNQAEVSTLGEALTDPDPGYRFVNWVSAKLDWGVFGVNLFGGFVFGAGLSVFCRSQPRPWLALAVAMPYMVIVVAMGYSRQAIALGFAMLGLVALGRGAIVLFVFWVILGATFHKTAVLLLPLAAMAATRNRLFTAAWVGVTVVISYQLLLEDSVDYFIENYVRAEYASEGALIRLLMNAVPAAVFLVWRGRFGMAAAELRLWSWFAAFSLVLAALFPVVPSSTALDRMALYLLPLQLVVFSRLPEVLIRSGGRAGLWVYAVLAYYAAVLFVWLNFASHAQYWIPYRFYPLEAWT
jgi:hypothetical protein